MTVGKVATDLLLKQQDKVTPIEQMRESLTDYEKNFWECVQEHRKVWDQDFYVVVITKKERLFHNVLRNYFLARISCPTPDYDQSVYKITLRNEHDGGKTTLKNEHVELLWTLPARDICFMLLENRTEVAPYEAQLLKYVYDFHDGMLFKKAQLLNKEIE